MLTEAERARIGARTREFEAATGAQMVTAVIARSDDYPEIPWKAFALGAALTALARVLVDLARPDWIGTHAVLLDAVLVLGVGAAAALATIRIHPLARLFLHPSRAEAEVVQHARELFLRHEVFGTSARNGLLILVSRFERRMAVIPDTGLAKRIHDADLQRIIAAMRAPLADGKACDAVCAGIETAEALLREKGWQGARGADSGLPNTIIEEDGHAPRR